jgi:ankyrin repeat protein
MDPALRVQHSSPLHAAAANGDVESIKQLVKALPRSDAIDEESEGSSPLALAVRHKQVAAVRHLLMLGANPNAGRKPPLLIAIGQQAPEIGR